MIGVVGLVSVVDLAIVAVAWVRGVGLSSLKQELLRELVRGVARDFVLFDFTDLSYLYPRFAFCRF